MKEGPSSGATQREEKELLCLTQAVNRKIRQGNLFENVSLPGSDEPEFFEALIPDQGCLIERIVSTGQTTEEGKWYDQERDEWVALLKGQAVLLWEDGSETAMNPGDWILIPAHRRHRVIRTSQNPPCFWIAFHGRLCGSQKFEH